jgi:hypothetical protein
MTALWRIVLKKSFLVDDSKFSGPLARLARYDRENGSNGPQIMRCFVSPISSAGALHIRAARLLDSA